MARNLSEAAAKTGLKNKTGCIGKVIGGGVVAVILLIFLGYVFNFADTDANRIGLHYGGGIIEDKKFKSIIAPGSTNEMIGPGDTVYTYPTTSGRTSSAARARTPPPTTRSPWSAVTMYGSAYGSRCTSP